MSEIITLKAKLDQLEGKLAGLEKAASESQKPDFRVDMLWANLSRAMEEQKEVKKTPGYITPPTQSPPGGKSIADGTYEGDILYWVPEVGEEKAHWAILERPSYPAVLVFDPDGAAADKLKWLTTSGKTQYQVLTLNDSGLHPTWEWTRAHG